MGVPKRAAPGARVGPVGPASLTTPRRLLRPPGLALPTRASGTSAG
jgi:hypothetical protein